MTVYVSLPRDLFGKNLTDLWNQLYSRLVLDYKGATITSNYTGDGTLESADVVLFIYEFKDYKSYEPEIRYCEEHHKFYRFFKGLFEPLRLDL